MLILTEYVTSYYNNVRTKLVHDGAMCDLNKLSGNSTRNTSFFDESFQGELESNEILDISAVTRLEETMSTQGEINQPQPRYVIVIIVVVLVQRNKYTWRSYLFVFC